eukprot:14644299-Alexandrium_andersonii.AAC.1
MSASLVGSEMCIRDRRSHCLAMPSCWVRAQASEALGEQHAAPQKRAFFCCASVAWRGGNCSPPHGRRAAEA